MKHKLKRRICVILVVIIAFSVLASGSVYAYMLQPNARKLTGGVSNRYYYMNSDAQNTYSDSISDAKSDWEFPGWSTPVYLIKTTTNQTHSFDLRL